MTWTTLTLEVTTPLFNGDAEAGISPGEEAGVRVASIRGVMRFWFRALVGALTGPDLPLLAALERRVFGGIGHQRGGGEAAVPSPLILRLPSPPRPSRELSISRDQAPWIGYLLGLGLMKPKGGMPDLIRPCVTPGTRFELKLRFQHDRRATPEVCEAVESLAFVSLWLACTYGGFGARTRRGFGGARIVDVLGRVPAGWRAEWLRTPGLGFYTSQNWPWPWPPRVFGAFERHLPELIKAETGTADRQLDSWTEEPPFPVLSRTYSPAVLARGPRSEKFESWQEALAHAGKQLRLFRANRPADAARRQAARVRTVEWDSVINGDSVGFPLGALGLPVGFHDKLTNRKFMVNAVHPAGADHEELRRASPLWLRAVGSGNSWYLLTFAFRTRFLPGTEQVRLLPDKQAIRDGWHDDELFVDQADVDRLTGQWMAALRDGGDFTTILRE
jgi:hypothetical protein